MIHVDMYHYFFGEIQIPHIVIYSKYSFTLQFYMLHFFISSFFFGRNLLN